MNFSLGTSPPTTPERRYQWICITTPFPIAMPAAWPAARLVAQEVQHELEYVQLYVLAETSAEARARIRSLPDYGLHAENLSTEFGYPCDLDQEAAKSEEIIDPDKVIREFNHRGDELLLIKRLRDTGLNPAQIVAFIVTLDRILRYLLRPQTVAATAIRPMTSKL